MTCQLIIFKSFFLLQSKRALLRKYFAAALSSFDELYNIYSALLDIHCILRDRIAERIWTRRVDSYQAISRYDCCSPRRRWPPMDPAPQWGHSKNQFCILKKKIFMCKNCLWMIKKSKCRWPLPSLNYLFVISLCNELK